MRFTASQLASYTGGRLVHDGRAGELTTDTRRIQPDSWFVALVGETFDGHDFLAMAGAAGCAGAVVAEGALGKVPATWTAGLVVVPDTLVALQSTARAARESFSGPVVGVTGSAGKTSTRVMIVEVLRELGRVHHTLGNLNNHIGLPLTLAALPVDADVVVVEMGMNHPGEIALLQDIARPNVRLITNVGLAHVEGCGSILGVARAKQELFDGARPGDVVVVNADDPWIANMPIPEGVRVIRFGRDATADVVLTDVVVDAVRLATRIRITTPDGVVRATLGVPGVHLALNAAAAAAVAFALRVPVGSVGAALARYEPEGMRNRVERIGGVTVLDDAYNANPVSMSAALHTLASLQGRRIAVLGDMLELGAAEPDSHAAVVTLAVSLGLHGVLTTGTRLGRATIPGVRHHADVDALADDLVADLRAGDVVLVKGSRGSRMERVVERIRAARAE